MWPKSSARGACTPDEPKVCVRRANAALLDHLREPGREVLALMAEKLPEAPTSVVQTFYGGDAGIPAPEPRAPVVYAEIFDDDLTEHDVWWTLAMGAGTQFCPGTGTPSTVERYDAARRVAAAWLLGEEPLAPSDPDGTWGWLPSTTVTGPAYDTLLSMADDEQQARVTELREAELACDTRDRLDLLVGTDGAG